MQVILRHAHAGFYYAGPTCWVNGRERALDLQTVEHAVEAAREEHIGSLEIVAWFDRLSRELVFPVRFDGTTRLRAHSLGVQIAMATPPDGDRVSRLSLPA